MVEWAAPTPALSIRSWRSLRRGRRRRCDPVHPLRQR
jgi:hypothetical protein